jgi:HlyD family secretion protein
MGRGSEQRVWVLRDGQAVEVTVTVGVTDGRMTELLAGGLGAGMHVITEVAKSTK